MDEWKGKFTGVLENVEGYVVENSGGVLKIEFEYDGGIETLASQLDQGIDKIAKLTDAMGAEFYR